MKTILSALLVISALSFSAKAFAATNTSTSMCEVFISPSNEIEKRYETVTTCDGKQGAVFLFDDTVVGTVAPLTQAVHAVLEKGYALVNCAGKGDDAACYLTK